MFIFTYLHFNMKKTILLIALFFFTVNFYGQKEANIWYFGNKAGLDFNSATPQVITGSQMNTLEGCATISDGTGQVLFYTDGITVWNKNHQIMPNGKKLMGHPSSTQSAVIIPKPENPDIYYIFTTTEADDENGARYSEVDMSLNGGLGDVNSNKNILLFTLTCEKITATRNIATGELWVVLHEFYGDRFFSYKVTKNGINMSPVISNSGFELEDKKNQSSGSLKFSPDGTKLISCNYYRNAELFDFDGNTGKISNARTVISRINHAIYGLEFSPSGNFAYITYGEYNTANKLSQFDLKATDIPGSETLVYDGTVNSDILGGVQIATNGKIYGISLFKNFLFAINNPDAQGAACDFELNAVSLGPDLVCNFGLPSFIQSYFISNINVQNNCLGELTSFSLSNSQSVTSAVWDFGDGTGSTDITATHTYPNAGNYTVSVIANNGPVKTTEVIISETPTAMKPQNMLACDNDNDGIYSFDLTTQNSAILNGQDPSHYQVTYFANSSPILVPNAYSNSSAYELQTITAEISNKENTSCKSITTFEIDVFDSPVPKTDIPKLTSCDNSSVGNDTDGKIFFDLTQRTTDILNGQLSSQFVIYYYTDNAMTQEIISPAAYQNTNAVQTIYVKIANKDNLLCTATTSFKIEVFALPIITNIVSLKQCDDNVDGFTMFNLEEAIPKITNNASLETISFYKNLLDAQNNINPILNTVDYTNQIVSSDKVFARVSNTNSCFRISQLNLIVSTTQIPATYSKTLTDCDDSISGTNDDGISSFDFSFVTASIRQDVFPAGQLLDISYYKNIADALSEKNAISDISNYRNTDSPYSQKIFIRVDSRLNNECLGLGGYITLNVESIPVVKPLTVVNCDDDHDGKYAFDTTNLQSQLLVGLDYVNVTYLDQNNVQLPSPLPNPFVTSSQVIKVIVKNNTATSCSYESTITFKVDDLPHAFDINPTLTTVCDDETDPALQDGKYAFDTSAFESLIIGSQTGMTVHYYDAANIQLPSPLPNPFITATQTIKVEVINSINTNCSAVTFIPFVINPVPKITLKGTELVCSNLPNFTKQIDAGLLDLNAANAHNYIWFLNNTEIQGETSNVLTVNKEGIYTVKVSDKITQCSQTRTITVSASNIAQIQKIDIIDLAESNSITISVTGNGDYVFALDDQNGTYQSHNVFTDVSAGIHSIYVKDLNGCGIVSEEVAILGIPNFFTPNEDGQNDYWNIKGVNTSSNARTNIHIFDRYGKLLKQINPLDQGWDGTYTGRQMPADDYWYVIKLEDGRVFKGHFTLKR